MAKRSVWSFTAHILASASCNGLTLQRYFPSDQATFPGDLVLVCSLRCLLQRAGNGHGVGGGRLSAEAKNIQSIMNRVPSLIAMWWQACSHLALHWVELGTFTLECKFSVALFLTVARPGSLRIDKTSPPEFMCVLFSSPRFEAKVTITEALCIRPRSKAAIESHSNLVDFFLAFGTFGDFTDPVDKEQFVGFALMAAQLAGPAPPGGFNVPTCSELYRTKALALSQQLTALFARTSPGLLLEY